MTREQKSLRTTGLLFAVAGIVLAAGAWPPLYWPSAIFLDIAHWPFHGAPRPPEPATRLLLAIAGGLTVGFGAAIWTVASQLMGDHPSVARAVIRNAALSWFAVDSTFSVVAGAPMNVALNLVFLAAVLWPMRKALSQRDAAV
ncbi:MAG: hypothetical protein AAGH73_12325 [Pseudomonadota bacterium]